MEIRPYRPSDRTDCYDICLRTGRAGGDATGIYSQPDLLPDIFCGPYLAFAPELSFVVDDGARAVGYVLGVGDTAAFVAWYRENWLPDFASRYHLTDDLTLDEREMLGLGLDPERMLGADLAQYPAHLHIDLLPDAQGHGLGRTLIDTLIGALRAQGVRGVHLEMDPANEPARGFYERLGFHRLAAPDPDAMQYGMSLAAPA